MVKKNDIVAFYDADYATEIGGAQKRIFEILRNRSSNYTRIYWCSFKFWKKSSIFYQDNGITYFGVLPKPSLYNKNGTRSQFEPILYFINVLLCSPFWITKESFLIGQWPLTHIPLVALLGRALRKQVVIEWWETWDQYWIEKHGSRLGYYLERLCLIIAQFTKSAVVTDCIEEREKAENKQRNLKISVVENGVDLQYFKNKKFELKNSIFELVILGRLKSHKRVDLLINAISHLQSDDIKNHIRLKIIGDGPERTALENLVRKKGLQESVSFLGALNEYTAVAEELSKASCGVLCTESGGSGNVTAKEYLAAGIPVIAVLNGSMGLTKGLVQNGHNGLTVDRPDDVELARKIKEIYSNNELYTHLLHNVRAQYDELGWNQALAHHPICN